MVNLCCVEGCEKGSEHDVTLFKFPTSRAHRRKWLDAIKSSGKLSSKDIAGSVICNNHFNSCDYEDIRGKIRLKSKVVPCLFGDEQSDTSPKSPKEPDIQQDVLVTPIEDELLKQQNEDIGTDKETMVKQGNENVTDSDKETMVKQGNENATDNKVVNANETFETKRVADESTDSAAESVEENCIEVTPQIPEESPPPTPEMDTNKHDIEDILTSYHLMNNPSEKQIHPISEEPKTVPIEVPVEGPGDKGNDSDIEIEPAPKPMFIEISVDKGPTTAGNENGNSQDDCLMLLENVQVDIDPSSLMLPERDDDDDDDDDVINVEEKKADPISLLTSSDEDDVIIEEPEIDTVEVSDETDEDDMPLVKLVKRAHKSGSNLKKSQIRPDNITKMFWGMYEYYCMECHFTTTSRGDYRRHVKEHATVIQICQICGYTTASKTQFARHKRKHKDEKKFKCHLCDYKAKHNMSLIYHLKSHDVNLSNCKKGFKCKKCNFRSDVKSAVLKHFRMCSMNVKKFSCKMCPYETKRQSDLRRHIGRKHGAPNEDNDEEYVPGMT